MASSPSTRLRIELQAAGENLNTWGAPKLNTALQRLEEAVCGFYSGALSGNATLTSSNYSGDQAHMGVLNFTSGTGGTVTIPGVEKTYDVRNNTSGNVILTTGAGGSCTIVAGDSTTVLCDATNCYAEQQKDFGGSKLTNVGTPTNATDGANKAYVDAVAVTSIPGSLPSQTGNAGKFLKTNGSNVLWDNAGSIWTSIAANIGLGSGSANAVDTTASRSLTLPATPGSGGAPIRVADITGTASTNNISTTSNGSDTINGVASDTFVIDNNWGDVTFVPVSGGWVTVIQ